MTNSRSQKNQRNALEICDSLLGSLHSVEDRRAMAQNEAFKEEVHMFVREQFLCLRDEHPEHEFDHSFATLAVDYLAPFEDDTTHNISSWHILRSLRVELNGFNKH